jgi:hypothetical protein
MNFLTNWLSLSVELLDAQWVWKSAELGIFPAID